MVLKRRSSLPRPLKSKQRRWGVGVPEDIWRRALLHQHVIHAQSVVWKGWKLYQHSAGQGNWTLNPSGNFVKYAARWLRCVADQKCHPALSSCQKEPVRVLGALTNYCSLGWIGDVGGWGGVYAPVWVCDVSWMFCVRMCVWTSKWQSTSVRSDSTCVSAP